MRNHQVGCPEATDVLADLVPRITYKPSWKFELAELDRGQGCHGLTLIIGAQVPDSTVPGSHVEVLHLFPVLPAAYNQTAWEDWVLECILMVEKHETLEFFQVDGVAPYFSDHGPGRNPYAQMRIKPPEQPAEAAVPWFGKPASGEHFGDVA